MITKGKEHQNRRMGQCAILLHLSLRSVKEGHHIWSSLWLAISGGTWVWNMKEAERSGML